MIKANELRIGNLVRYEDRNFKIYALSKELPCLDTIEYGIGVVSYKTIQPIELTEDILIKCGFEWRNEHRGVGAIMDFNKQSIGLMENGEVRYLNCWVKLEYLHQLQNLYYCLTGKELEIKL